MLNSGKNSFKQKIDLMPKIHLACRFRRLGARFTKVTSKKKI